MTADTSCQTTMLWCMCKSYYFQQVWVDLNGTSGFYSRLQQHPTRSSSVCCNNIVDNDLVCKATHGCSATYWGTGYVRQRCHLAILALCKELSAVIPYEVALVKLHKTSVAFKFLACSAKNGLRQPAVSMVDFLCFVLSTSWLAVLLVPVVGQAEIPGMPVNLLMWLILFDDSMPPICLLDNMWQVVSEGMAMMLNVYVLILKLMI